MSVQAMTVAADLPRWDLSNVYAALDSDAFRAGEERLKAEMDELDAFFAQALASVTAESEPPQVLHVLDEAVERLNSLYDLAGTRRAYIIGFVATDSRNAEAAKALSKHEQLTVKLDQLVLRFRSWVGSLGEALEAALQAATPAGSVAQAHAFVLRETAQQARYLMSPAEENLAAEMTLSGGNGWGKLQGTITSQLSAEIELDGRVQTLPMTAIINLRSHPDGQLRRRGYEVELKVWESVAEPLAACMNGVKGEVVTLNRRRGRVDALHAAIDQARIDRQTLDAMIGAMHDALPVFRRYLHAKARGLGKAQLPWFDLFAPVGASERTYSYAEACSLVQETFGSFAPQLAALAERAFTQHWIDVAPRPGKRGGAFCMEVPAVGESRVLTNFDGSLDQVSTLAHELGHAFHNDCAVAANKTMLQSITPMTLAETASIMCETIVTEAILARTSDPQEVLAILETQLTGSTQVIVDIYSRFLFESEVFRRREQGELSPAELCEIMVQAQRDSYGDGLDPNHLHPYMWTWKPHYYRPTLSFYNFPYAFGLLFGTGLYAIYRERGAAFVPDYMNLLASTGEASAADLADRFGIDIRSRVFWERSLEVIAGQVARYEQIIGVMPATARMGEG
jgi:oligoendopeptidase F